MRWTVKTCLVTLVILFLWRDGEVAEACTCSPEHPQQDFCRADVVIRANVLKREEVHGGNESDDPFGIRFQPIKYNITQTKLYKGPNQTFDAVYTPSSSAACGVNLDEGHYVFAGHLQSDGTLSVSLCDFVERWDRITVLQKKGLMERYSMGCSCTITLCSSIPCATSKDTECLWTDLVLENQFSRTQAKSSACIKRNDGSCAWYRGMKPPTTEFLGKKKSNHLY